MSSYENPREAYRRRIQQRQTVIFGSIAVIMAFLLVFGTLVWVGAIPAPFNRGFSQKAKPTVVVPCPSDGIQAQDLSTITVRIYNSTSVNGQASTVGQDLATLGVTISETANWGGKPLDEATRIIAGKNGVDAAYTLRAYLPESTIQFDETNNSEVLDIVLGKKFDRTQVAPNEEEKSAALEALPKCKPVS